ncbi:MAG: GTP cyclohydrolase II [Bacteroidetes bacterium]|nr:GTP cyclohydrolase II [Bacteroidota bacterium]MDA0903759.1 GTP cyclohydrolase II [Bacteroidota bacterium]MDA1242561.1 GTP cyclohydrolase II [Bacteroidota bacterium]
MKTEVIAELPTEHGEFQVWAFRSGEEGQPHLVLVSKVLPQGTPLVRIHSECWTGDVVGSLRCDCGEQLRMSLKHIAEEGGALFYLRQEGRGIGLVEKLKAYNLQDQGLNTFEANIALGHEEDARSYEMVPQMLKELGWGSVRIMTNNPEKVRALELAGIDVEAVVPVTVNPNQHSHLYHQAKRELKGHGHIGN